MLFGLCVAALVGVSTARSIRPPILAQEPIQDEAWHFPTVHESAVLARRILHLTTIGDLVSSFPGSRSSQERHEDVHAFPQEVIAFENRPDEVAGAPIGLVEYYADCEPTTGNPTLLAINIATPYKNAAAGSNISLTVRWWPDQRNTYFNSYFNDDYLPTPHTPMALPRMSLHGYLEPISAAESAKNLIPACFMHTHPDSALWQPGNDVHSSSYVRLVVEHVYWLGGFGDRARIQWLPIEEWRNVTMEEVAEARLPGEEKKKKHKTCGELRSETEHGAQPLTRKQKEMMWEKGQDSVAQYLTAMAEEGERQRRSSWWKTLESWFRDPTRATIRLGGDW